MEKNKLNNIVSNSTFRIYDGEFFIKKDRASLQNERLNDVVEDLFYQFTNKLTEMGEIGYENVFVDETKIEANANRYSFVWKCCFATAAFENTLIKQTLSSSLFIWFTKIVTFYIDT